MSGLLDPKVVSAENERIDRVLLSLQALMTGLQMPLESEARQVLGLGPAIMIAVEPKNDDWPKRTS